MSEGNRPGAARDGRVGLTVALAAGMAAGTFTAPALAVLARFIIDDLGLTRAELGLATAAFSAFAATLSPAVGRLTDHRGGRRMLVATFVVAGLGVLLASRATSLAVLVLGTAVAGIGQATSNPATNKLISAHIPLGRRGLVTGLKQSGVQASVFLTGVALPSAALRFGWRTTLVAAAVTFLVAAALVPTVVPADRVDRTRGPRDRSPLPRGVTWLAVYGLLMGAAGGAVNIYLPLYAEEGVGLTVTLAGAIAGATGAVAFATRIAWAKAAERAPRFSTSLGWMAGLAVVFVLALLAAPRWGSWLLWVGALGHAATGTSWNPVGMLAVMAISGPARAGRGSGVVLLGFLAGLGLGPPAFGWSVDRTGGYEVGLVAAAAGFALAALLMLAWAREPEEAPARREVTDGAGGPSPGS